MYLLHLRLLFILMKCVYVVLIHLVLIFITNPISLRPFHHEFGNQSLSHQLTLKPTFTYDDNVLNKLVLREGEKDSEITEYSSKKQKEKKFLAEEQ